MPRVWLVGRGTKKESLPCSRGDVRQTRSPNNTPRNRFGGPLCAASTVVLLVHRLIRTPPCRYQDREPPRGSSITTTLRVPLPQGCTFPRPVAPPPIFQEISSKPEASGSPCRRRRIREIRDPHFRHSIRGGTVSSQGAQILSG